MRKNQKLAASSSLPASPLTDEEISAFITELYEAREYLEALEATRYNLNPSELVLRRTSLPAARKRVKDLETHLSSLRGDHYTPESAPAETASSTSPAKTDGRMRIQAEAYEHWIRLKATGANPSIHSICDAMARWCADNGVTTRTGVSPKAGTIRNTILGGSSGWEPPTHSRDQAQAHVAQLAQLAQVAQPAPANPD